MEIENGNESEKPPTTDLTLARVAGRYIERLEYIGHS
jgi:hypothetical protein